MMINLVISCCMGSCGIRLLRRRRIRRGSRPPICPHGLLYHRAPSYRVIVQGDNCLSRPNPTPLSILVEFQPGPRLSSLTHLSWAVQINEIHFSIDAIQRPSPSASAIQTPFSSCTNVWQRRQEETNHQTVCDPLWAMHTFLLSPVKFITVLL